MIGKIQQKTMIRFRNVDDFESYIKSIEVDYEGEDVIFTGWLRKLNTPQFNRTKRYQYGKNTDYKQDIAENRGKNCYIPTSGNCFVRCIKYFTDKDYKKVFFNFYPM